MVGAERFKKRVKNVRDAERTLVLGERIMAVVRTNTVTSSVRKRRDGKFIGSDREGASGWLYVVDG